MKIAFVAPYDFSIPGGVNNHVCGLAKTLIAKGHESFILGTSSNKLTPDVPNFVRLGEFPKARSISFAPHWRVPLRTARNIHTVFKAEQFDIIHLHEPLIPPLCLSALFSSRASLFATFHTYYEKGQALYALFQPILNKTLQRLRGRIVVSKSAGEYINRYFPYDYKIIPNGIHVDKFNHPKEPKNKNHPFHLLFVGHQKFNRKGLSYLIEAYLKLKTDYPLLRLTIVGANWSGAMPSLPQAALEKNDITFLGMVSDNDLVALYQSADAFCAPSIGNESFGIVLLEAMAAGIPIVSTSIQGYANVIQHESNALIVPPKDSSQLAVAISQLIDNPDLRKHLVTQAKLRVQRYDWDGVANEVLNYYSEQLHT